MPEPQQDRRAEREERRSRPEVHPEDRPVGEGSHLVDRDSHLAVVGEVRHSRLAGEGSRLAVVEVDPVERNVSTWLRDTVAS